MLTHTHSTAKPKGTVITVGPDGAAEVFDTLQCCHCQMHWRVEPGSGRSRDFCSKCMGPTCGKEQCAPMNCYPAEKQLDDMEKGIWLPFSLSK